jgi:hypothetical protein
VQVQTFVEVERLEGCFECAKAEAEVVDASGKLLELRDAEGEVVE